MAVACLRHQLLHNVLISIGCGVAHICPRRSRLCTGIILGMAAQVPIRHACLQHEHFWKQHGFELPSGFCFLTMFTYVGNCLAAARSFHAVIEILDDSSNFLPTELGFRIKPSSRLVMAPQRCPDTSVNDPQKYPVVDSTKVLGHILQSDVVQTCASTTPSTRCGRCFASTALGRWPSD